MNNNIFIMQKIIDNKDKYLRLFLRQKSILDFKSSSQKIYTSVINTFYTFIKIQIDKNVDLDSIKYMEYLKKGRQNKTVNYHMMVIVEFMTYLYNKKYISEQIFLKQKNLKVPITRKQSMSTDQLYDIIEKLPDVYKLIVKTLYATGMRKAELIRLKVKEVQQGTIIQSKYDNQRSIYFTNEIYEELQKYIQDNNKKPNDFLFTSNRNKKFNESTWNVELKKYDINPHQLRALYATKHVQNGMSDTMLQVLMGHKSITTTQGYIRHTDEDIQKQINKAI